jgi:mRNA interferase MazF
MVAKVRPGLVLSVPVGPQDCALATLVGHTTSARGSQFEVAVQARFLQAGAFDAQSLVTVPHAKLLRKLGDLTADQVASVEEAIRRWLGL